MKNRAGAIASAGVPQVSVAVDAYFPRARLADCLRTLHAEFPTVLINLRITTMQDGERLVLDKTCALRSEEHTSELQSLMRTSYAVFCLKKKNDQTTEPRHTQGLTTRTSD